MSRLKTIEDEIYAYLQTLTLTGTANLAELPETASSVTVAEWTFGLSGGDETTQVRSDEDTYAWTIGAYWRGVYSSRDTALADLWKIMDATPLSSGEVSSIQRMSAATMPIIPRESVRIANDLASGGESRVWAVEMTFLVTFERS